MSLFDYEPISLLKDLKIIQIEGITGLKDLDHVFDDRLNETDIEMIVIFLNKKYDLSLGDSNPFDFIVSVIKFSFRSLRAIKADFKEFYDNMTTKESVIVILTKLLITTYSISTTNGFPTILNYNSSMSNKSQEYIGDKKWFPYVKGDRRMKFDQLLARSTNMLDLTDKTLLFHGTSWESAFSIYDEIEIFQRQRATDFGMRNFYLTDTFKTACIWASRNVQSAILIFCIPNTFLDELENYSNFNERNIEDWKQLVFKCRNPPLGRNIQTLRREYRNFIDTLDDMDCISGSILANPSAPLDEIKYIKYGSEVPYQYSFKDSTIDILNNFLSIVIFFEQN